MGFSTEVTDYLGSDVLANRPVAPNIETSCGAVYFASDVRRAFIWNSPGSAWDNLALVPTASGLVISDGTVLATATLGAGLGLSGGTTLSNTGVLSFGGDAGTIHIGAGLSEASNTLSNTGVLSIGGATGALVLGTNLSLSGNTLDASPGAGGVASVTDGTHTVGTGGTLHIGAGLTLDSGGSLTTGGAGVPGAGLVSSNGTALVDTTIVGGSWSSNTLTITGGAGAGFALAAAILATASMRGFF